MYESNSAKNLKIGITGNVDIQQTFNDLLNDTVLQSVKTCQNFSLTTNMINEDTNTSSYGEYNFIFYVTSLDKILDKKTMEKIVTDIQKISTSFPLLIYPRNHLFIIIDGCNNMEIDDDGDLILSDKTENSQYQNFDTKISGLIADNLFHICKISLEMANIWKLISNDSSMVNLSEDQINQLAPQLISKSEKMSNADKKRSIRTALKKVEIVDKIAESGYTEFYETVTQYLKIISQKKMVCQNYLFALNNLTVTLKKPDTENIRNLIKEIYDISYLKTDMHDDLIDKVSSILLTKLKAFYDKSKNHVAVEFKLLNNIDVHEYYNFLLQIMEISNEYKLSSVKDVTKKEMDKVNELIINYHNKEVEKVTDLEKISNFLEILAAKDKNNLFALFEKIKSHPKIMSENIEKMDKWIIFVNKCLKLAIPRESVIKLMEEIIMAKIAYYVNVNIDLSKKSNGIEISTIYPQCLQIFLLSNLNHFVFKKLYMFISYSIRYSGRNIADLIKNLTSEQYENLLMLENRLLELCSQSIDEQTQPLNLTKVDVIETSNEDNKKIQCVDTKKIQSEDTTNKKPKKNTSNESSEDSDTSNISKKKNPVPPPSPSKKN